MQRAVNSRAIATVNSVLSEIYRTGTVEDADGVKTNPFPSATPFAVGSVLSALVTENRFTSTLEVGMAFGLSTLFLCEALRSNGGGKHIAIDSAQSTEWKSIGLLNVRRAGLDDLVRFMEEPSHGALWKLLSEGQQLDFAFIDGSHLFDYTLIDFFLVDKMLRTGGMVVFDDLWMPAVRDVVSYVVRNRAYRRVPITTIEPLWRKTARVLRRAAQTPFAGHAASVRFCTSSIFVLRKEREDERDWDFHRSFA